MKKGRILANAALQSAFGYPKTFNRLSEGLELGGDFPLWRMRDGASARRESGQSTLFPVMLDDLMAQETEVGVIDAWVE
ncbi:hypothetical protein [Noviherbaspirillum agri]